MEKQLIHQLISNGLSIKKIKDIVGKLEEDEPNQDLNKTTIANTCGLRLIKCGSCNKKFYEDKFMLNRLNKRYRSCIECVMRQRTYRQKDNIINTDKHLKNDNINNNVLALLDKEYDDVDDDKISLEEINDNSNVSIASIETQDVMDEPIIPIVKTNNEKPKQLKPKKNKNNSHMFSILHPQPEIAPEEVGLRFFKLFN